MALIGSADIMLLDEPTNDVDPVRREKQWRLLQNWLIKDTLLSLLPTIY